MKTFNEQVKADRQQAQWIADAVIAWNALDEAGRTDVELIARLFDKPLSWALDYHDLVIKARQRRWANT